MTVMQSLVAFSAAAALLTVTPGLDTALVLRTAMSDGPRPGLLAGLGVCAGCLAWGVLVSIGLGAVLDASHAAYTLLRWLGAGYLACLGLRLLLRRGGSLADAVQEPFASPEPVHAGRIWFVRGLFTNLLNPKVGVFYATLLPQFIPSSVSVTSFSILLAAIHALMGLIWFAFLVTSTRALSAWLRQPSVGRTLDRITGLVFLGFGARLALDRSQ